MKKMESWVFMQPLTQQDKLSDIMLGFVQESHGHSFSLLSGSSACQPPLSSLHPTNVHCSLGVGLQQIHPPTQSSTDRAPGMGESRCADMAQTRPLSKGSPPVYRYPGLHTSNRGYLLVGGGASLRLSLNIETRFCGVHGNGSNDTQHDVLHSEEPVFLEEDMTHACIAGEAHVAQNSEGNHDKLLQMRFVSTSQISIGPSDSGHWLMSTEILLFIIASIQAARFLVHVSILRQKFSEAKFCRKADLCKTSHHTYQRTKRG